MSLDYPNRKDWLAVRASERNRRSLAVREIRLGTLDRGRNKAKRDAREDQKIKRAIYAHSVQFGNAPKINMSEMMTLVMSNRRLRQRTIGVW